MRPELDEALCERYPAIFAERHADPVDTAMCWGFEVGDGWFTLIDVLCRELQRMTDDEGGPQVVAKQVKQKNGLLRFHVATACERQLAMIQLAQSLSHQLCESCGAPGRSDQGPHPSISCRVCQEAGAQPS